MFSDWFATEYGAGCVRAVAEPNPVRRAIVAEAHGIPADRCFETWDELLNQPKMGDILINATMDKDHVESATRAMRLGYHMLLEKPMAVTLRDCETIDRVRQETGRLVSVCHSLRYHAVFSQLREILRSGVLGEIAHYDHLESIEHIHMSHSFVRGNWGFESESTFLLMAKACHDVDILMDMVNQDVVSVSSNGSLMYFCEANAPADSPDFCVEGCPHATTCPYEATKLYLTDTPWANHAGFTRMPRQQALDALRTARHGRCVFRVGNDNVDHQVASFAFEGGATGTLTVSAFLPKGGRLVKVHCTKGYLEADIEARTITYWEFWKGNQQTTIQVPEGEGYHGGADALVMRALVAAVEHNDPSLILTDTAESLRTHAVVFHAEQARREGRIVHVQKVSV